MLPPPRRSSQGCPIQRRREHRDVRGKYNIITEKYLRVNTLIFEV